MTNCVATTIANVTSGRTTNGIVAFESNVVRVGYRQRFPEQDAAIAAFAVQRVETIEHANNEGSQY